MGYLLRNASIIDGLNNPAIQGDLLIVGDRIRDSGLASKSLKHTEIDAEGLTVMPGFVDMHSHSDLELIRDPTAAAKTLQGVTLEVLGQDGLSYAPSSARVFESLSRQLRGWNGETSNIDWEFNSVGSYIDGFNGRSAVNVAYLVPAGTLRLETMSDPTGRATVEQTSRMQKLLAEGLAQGAVGMSAGLMYYPGQYSTDTELVSLTGVVSEYDGYFAPHHRNYGTTALDSYEDMLIIGKSSGCAIHLTHANLSFPVNRGRAHLLLEMLDRYEEMGVDITLDTYPYAAGSTALHELFPSWMKAGGPGEMLSRLRDLKHRNRLHHEMNVVGTDSYHGLPMDWSKLVLSHVGQNGQTGLEGQSILEASKAANLDPVDFAAQLLDSTDLDVVVIAHIGNEENIVEIMQDHRHCVGTDGLLRGSRPHPRGWGAFPRFLGRYVRDLSLMSLERASHKLSFVPCQRLGLPDRGFLGDGAMADVVVLDAERVIDTATFETPRGSPVGIHYVFVNGEPVVWLGQVTGNTPGRSVRRH